MIPDLRGPLLSRPIGDVLSEAKKLLDAGVKELLVVSQDTSAYGVDVKYRTGFWQGRPIKSRSFELIETLGRLAQPYGAWVRLHYVYPYPSVDALIPLMNEGLVLSYLDIPLQHAHPDVLKRMKRPASGEKHLERIAAWREMCPELVIRSTFIAGFPGESEAEFEYLLNFMREAQIDRAGCFAYSPVQGAQANALPGQLPDEVREARRSQFMAVAESVSAQKLGQRIGMVMQVLIDYVPQEDDVAIVARSYADAPEIDGLVHIVPPENGREALQVGSFAEVEIIDTQGHDLIGELWVE